MTRSIRHSIAACVALAALAQPALAQPQQCVSQQDVADAAVYAMPLVYAAHGAKCSAQRSPTGYFAREGSGFVARFSKLQDSTWPATLRVLQVFTASSGASGATEMANMVALMPEKTLRPFVDSLIQQKIAEQIKPADCGRIERAAELLAPLPPENFGGVIALMFDFARVKNPPLCPARPK